MNTWMLAWATKETKGFVFYRTRIRFCCHLLWGILIYAMTLIYTFCTQVWTNTYLPSQGSLRIMFLCRWKSPGGNECSVSENWILCYFFTDFSYFFPLSCVWTDLQNLRFYKFWRMVSDLPSDFTAFIPGWEIEHGIRD